MKMSTFAKLGTKHIRNAMAETLYLKTGHDTTRPVSFYVIINERCNVKCRFCQYWRLDNYRDELSIEGWQQGLQSIKQLVGSYSINFSGGEPFLKKGFTDLLAFCHDNGIHSGVTTNGSTLTQIHTKKIVAAHPLNINISCDAPNAEVHDYLRGSEGLFDKISRGIQYLREAQEAQNIQFPIVLKPTVNLKNFRLLPELVEWAKEVGATAVNFQPMGKWTPETYDELWIEEDLIPELEQVSQQLIQMKQAGEPIMNSPQVLGLLSAHFRGEKAPMNVLPCRVGMRNYFINVAGEVRLCLKYPKVGKITEKTAKEIWYGEEAKQVRKDTVACKELCLISCLSQKTLKDKFNVGKRLLNATSKIIPTKK